jgi:RecG-like helicase
MLGALHLGPSQMHQLRGKTGGYFQANDQMALSATE